MFLLLEYFDLELIKLIIVFLLNSKYLKFDLIIYFHILKNQKNYIFQVEKYQELDKLNNNSTTHYITL
jgi:hypothetical protein